MGNPPIKQAEVSAMCIRGACIKGLASSHFNKQVVCTNHKEVKSEQICVLDVEQRGGKL
jgi:hypothetical protein